MNAKQIEDLMSWIDSKLNLVDKCLQDAKETKNYGKELQFTSKKEAYHEFLLHLQKNSIIQVS